MKAVIKSVMAWDRMSPERRALVRKAGVIAENMALALGSLAGLSLHRLARIANTKDFGTPHAIQLYDRALRPMRWKPLSILEIGVGGYDDHDGGRSLRLWRAFFPRARIAALDLYDKTALSRGRIQVFQGSQADSAVLERIARNRSGFDVIIDDGSHINAHQIRSFNILFPHLRPGGVYIIEDTQTSYWQGFGGGAVGSAEYARSCMALVKNLVDGLNHTEFPDPAYRASTLDREIVSIQFARNLIIIEKGDNSGVSNIGRRWDLGSLNGNKAVDHAGKITV
jgi:demethylmacrocin O-methyltransferase